MENIVSLIENYLLQYVTFAEDFYKLPAALWPIACHAWQAFDAFPYMGITALTKKAGKTTFKNCLVPLVPNGKKYSASSPARMYMDLGIDDDQDANAKEFPVMFIDECEKLASESHPAREFLNNGFERGEKITRVKRDYDCFCPKVFVGIGGVYDTLRDRSIIIMMKRRDPVAALRAKRVRLTLLEEEGNALRATIAAAVADKKDEIRALYESGETLSELTGATNLALDERQEKAWMPLFIMAKLFCPERVDELLKIAVDMEADKDAPQIRATGDDWEKAERDADDLEARVLLLRDMVDLLGDKEYLLSSDVVEQLKAIATAGWRRYRGRGLTPSDMGYLLDALNVHPKNIRLGARKDNRVNRGYKREDLIAAATLAGLIDTNGDE